MRDDVKLELGRRKDLFQTQEWDGPHAPGITTFTAEKNQDLKQVSIDLMEKCNIAVKLLRAYPGKECPAMRLSWSVQTNEREILFALEKIGELIGDT